jgi:amidase
MAIAEYDRLDGLGMAALVRSGQVKPLELLEEAVARTDRVNARINAVVRPLYDEARRAAQGPLPDGPFTGLPFLLKDLQVALAGVPLTSASRFMAAYKPAHDSTLVTRYRKAGVVFFGKTNTPEMGLLPFTEPVLFGPARNPWSPAHTPGGSSGGAAAAVAAGIVPVAHASDGGGSIRMPASCCGLFGLKPTRGRTPVGPDVSEVWSGLAVEHVVSRTVRDSAAMLDATAGWEATGRFHAPGPERPFLDEVGAPPGRMRIGFTKRPQLSSAPLHPDCAAAVDDAAKLLAELGHDVEEADLDIDPEAFARDFFTVVCVEMATLEVGAALLVGRKPRRGELEPGTAITALIGRQTSALAHMMARERLNALARRTAGFFERFDLMLSPTLGRPPAEIGTLAPQGIEAWAQKVVLAAHLGFLLRIPALVRSSTRRVFDFMPFTPLANITGQPSMSVPLHWNAAGLPIGTQLTARFGDEARLFRLAAQLEAARPWKDRRPPVSAAAAS